MERAPHWVCWVTRGTYALTILSPRLQSALHLGLGINQEVGAGDDPFRFVQARLDFVEVSIFATEFDEARLKFAFAFIHENDVTLAGRQHSGHRGSDAFAHVHLPLNIHSQVGP